jgi:hypothetical protein
MTPPAPEADAVTCNVETLEPIDDRPGERPPPPLRSILPRLREIEEYIEASSVRTRIAERRALLRDVFN